MSKGVCPFTRLLGGSSALPAGGGSSSHSSHSGHTQSNGAYSALATPSFEPNSPPDHLAPEQVSIGSIVAAINDKNAVPDDPAHAALTVEDVLLPDELVWSEPVSKLLKVGTARAHQDAETSAGAEALVKGQLELEEYIRWNAILWRVYNALELALEENSDHSVLAPTFDPATLARSTLIANDIKYLLTLLPSSSVSTTASSLPPASSSSSQATPLPPFPLPSFLLPVFTSPPAALTTYINHLAYLSHERPEGVLAHAYVRYLGDMSGGQFIAARVKRAYSLPKHEGTEFYEFSQGGKGGLEGESMADMKRRLGEIKDWYRRGMDEGVGEDVETKQYLVKEANLAFALNTHLFSLINPPSSLVPASAADHLVTTTGGTGTIGPITNQPLDPSQPQKRYYELQAERRAAEAKLKAEAEKLLPKPTWRDTAGKFAFAAGAVVVGQVVARYGVPLARQLYDEYLAGASK